MEADHLVLWEFWRALLPWLKLLTSTLLCSAAFLWIEQVTVILLWLKFLELFKDTCRLCATHEVSINDRFSDMWIINICIRFNVLLIFKIEIQVLDFLWPLTFIVNLHIRWVCMVTMRLVQETAKWSGNTILYKSPFIILKVNHEYPKVKRFRATPCSIYPTQRGLTAADPEATTVLQTCLPSCCPQNDSSTPPLNSVSAIATGSWCHPSITPDFRPAGSHSSHSISALFWGEPTN